MTEENGVKVGTNDPILMHFLLSFDWQIGFSLLTEVVKSSKWLKIDCQIILIVCFHQQLPKSVTFTHKTELNSVKDSIEAGVMFCSSLVYFVITSLAYAYIALKPKALHMVIP